MEGTPKTNEELINAFREVSQPRGKRPQGKQVPLTTTHEIRLLRAEVESMEEELRGLQSKWYRQLKDDRVLSTAQQSVREKHAVAQAEKVHNDLLQLLQQQQILFATLQSALHQAPLQSSGSEMFEALHFNTQLGDDPTEREKLLLEHKKRSHATLPSIVNTFSQMAIDKALESVEEKEKSITSMLPFSRIDITAYEGCTLVSSVFVTEIPHTSLEDVYAAVLAYFDAIPTSMKRHFGVEAKRRRLNDTNSPVVYRCSTFRGGGLPSTVNNIVCSELTPSHGMVHIDAVTDDPLFPLDEESPLQYSTCGLTITPCKEAITDKTLSMTLRWTVVFRYNMLPFDPAIKKDLDIIRPLLNGDLITASVVSFIQEKQHQRNLPGLDVNLV